MEKWQLTNTNNGVYTLTISREKQRNALDLDLILGITNAVNTLPSDCRVFVLASVGDIFCAGADINWMKDSAKLSAQQNQADAYAFATMLKALDHLPHPTIARVQGAALGGGVGIISCCDAVVAAENAMFALSEVRLGIIPATISPYVIEAIGPRAARRYFQSAEKFDAQRAYEIGLVSEVCQAGALDTTLDNIIDAMLQCGPYAQGQAKKLVRDISTQGHDPELVGSLGDRLAAIRTGDEAQEGFSAFIEKRKPNWME
ncbi:MAG: enoyl-CoA hydratase-related protein [Granulosicoccaceae bacterium]